MKDKTTFAVEFEHRIESQVKIVAIGLLGRVDSLCYDISGMQYRVRYWSNGVQKSDWMYSWEIESV